MQDCSSRVVREMALRMEAWGAVASVSIIRPRHQPRRDLPKEGYSTGRYLETLKFEKLHCGLGIARWLFEGLLIIGGRQQRVP